MRFWLKRTLKKDNIYLKNPKQQTNKKVIIKKL